MDAVTGYSISSYGAMTSDDARMNAYAAALRQAVTAESVVLDIGAGTGIWSLLACKYGARHVYAVEPDNSIFLARELADANGFANRITFLQDVSTKIDLPEAAHVIVSDLRGVLPYFEQHIASIADARARHMAAGGVLIPQRDKVYACPVEAPDTYQRLIKPWRNDVFGVDFSSRQKSTINGFHNEVVKQENLLAAPQTVATLDYRTITSPNVHSKLLWTVKREGLAHGVSLWFDAELANGIGFSTAPGQERTVYGMGLLLFTEPVKVAKQDTISVELKGNLVGNTYIWQWHTRFFNPENTRIPKTEFRQSTFDSSALAMEQLRKRAAHYVPQANHEGTVDRFILNMMDGKTSLEDISRSLATEFPDQFPTWQEALGWVGKLSLKYSR